jgi:hypothetical protein
VGIPLVEGKARVPRATRTASTNNDPVIAATVATPTKTTDGG